MSAPTWGSALSEDKNQWLVKVIESEIHPKYDHIELYKEFINYMCKESSVQTHSVRYFNTFGMLCKQHCEFENKAIMELGGMSPLTTFLSSYSKCSMCSSDLRYIIDAEDESLDFVFSFEVFEHLKDQTEESFKDIVLFNESGIRQVALEVERVLKPGGQLVLTTPNPNSYKSFENLLSGQSSMLFRPHVREYTKEELCGFFSAMTLTHYETSYSFYMLTENSRKNWEDIFEKNDWPQQHRGDDHFMIFEKPQ